MPLLCAVPVMLSAGERTTLNKRVRGAKTPWRDRLRAQVVLAAARGHPNAWIAAGLGVSVDTVRKWRGRFAARGLDGLAGLPRPGRPRRISAADRAAVVALACQLPAAAGVPLGRARVQAQRLPHAAGRPGRAHRAGVRLHPRHHRDQAVHGPGRPGHGPSGVQERTRVFVIAGNGSDRRGQAAISRLARAHPNAIMIRTPLHASWLNQIEIFFSVIQKKAATPDDFASLGQLSATLLGFVDRYHQTARPFSWKFTAGDPHDLMDRISRHEQQDDPHDQSLPEAA
jgi:hypothetical protein